MNHNTSIVRLGDYIEVCNERNYDLRYDASFIEGVNSDGVFCPTKAQTIDIDLKPYKIVRNGDFVYNPSRLNIGSLSYRETGLCIVSHLYVVFHLNSKGQQLINPYYLWIFFKRDQFRRLIEYSNYGSQRPEFNFYQMSEIEIPLPSLEVQQSLVAIYDGLQKIISENETLIQQLESVCHDFVIDCKNKYQKVKLGDWIEECDERNNDNALTLDNVRGISILKKFISTKADMKGVSLTPYKIVKKNWFACVPVTSRNGEKITLALYDEPKPAIVSSSYYVFRSKDENVLLPEYLFLFFKRTEFDRYARFNSWGSAREVFDFSEMCRVVIPLPPIETQRSIAAVAHSLEESKRIVQEARDLMKSICPALVQKAAHSA